MFTTLTTLLLALSLVTASPLLKKRLVEETPWHLTHLILYTSSGANSLNSTFSFTFADTNPGLQLNTTCDVSAPSIDADTYYACENGTVGWKYGGGRLDVRRGYVDPSVGPYPYWFVTAFGHANTSLKIVEDSEIGSKAVQDGLDVFVTELIA